MSSNASSGIAQDQIVREVEGYLQAFVKKRGLPSRLADAALYAGLGPGKRVRPTLVVRACEAVRGPLASLSEIEGLLPGAVAIEMVHAFSLVHDDLPAMDDDDLRRGRPTLHKHADEATAILAGDALLGLSFELVAAGVDDQGLGLALVRELSVGTNDMIAGQVRDTFPEDPETGAEDGSDLDRLIRTHRLKTGALLRAAVRMGGRCGGATGPQLDALTRYAGAVGLMFQVVDDLLDVTSDAGVMGKATQKDAAAGKRTYPGLLGVEGARAEAQRLAADARDALEPLGEHAHPLGRLADELAVRRK